MLVQNAGEWDKKMNIAFDGQLFLDAKKTGIAWNAHNLILELAKYPENKCTIRCFTYRCTKGQMQKLREYQSGGCSLECSSRFRGSWYKLAWACCPIPYSLFFRGKADVAQFFNYAVPPGVKGKRIVFLYDMVYKAYPETMDWKTRLWLAWIVKRSCRRADRIVTVSAFSKKEIIKYLQLPEEKIAVVPCGVDHSMYHPGYTKQQIQHVLDKYGIRQPYFLYLGTIEPRKNLQRLIGAYARLQRKNKEVPQLVLAGKKGWRCDGIYEKVRRLNLGSQVLFTGYVSQADSPLLMCGAKAFLFPSLYEGFGMPPLEAMACGTPVIVSDASSLPEVAGDAGILVDPYKEDSICHAMEKILKDEEYGRQAAVRGLQRASCYTWEKSARILMDVYRS